jgi:hypothetical protein
VAAAGDVASERLEEEALRSVSDICASLWCVGAAIDLACAGHQAAKMLAKSS